MSEINIIEETVYFSPFKVTIECETIDEARSLYHRLAVDDKDINNKLHDQCTLGVGDFSIEHLKLHDYMSYKSYLLGVVKNIKSDKK